MMFFKILKRKPDMNEENQVYFVDSDTCPGGAGEKHRLEQDPSFRTDHMSTCRA